MPWPPLPTLRSPENAIKFPCNAKENTPRNQLSHFRSSLHKTLETLAFQGGPLQCLLQFRDSQKPGYRSNESSHVDGKKMVHSYNGMLPSYPRIDVHFPFATKMKAPGNYAKQNESGGKKARIGGVHPRILEGNQSREQTEKIKMQSGGYR